MSISVILHFIGSESILEIKKLVILEDEAEVVCRVFELTNQRYFKMEICRLFNEEGGVLTPVQSMSRRQKSDSKKAASRGLQWTSDMI